MSVLHYTLSSLYGGDNKLPIVKQDEKYVERILGHAIDEELSLIHI